MIERRLRKDILISKSQFGFMSNGSTTKAIHLIKRLIKSYKDKKDLHIVFIVLECLEKKGVLVAYI